MRFINLSLSIAIILVFGLQIVSAQGDKNEDLENWDVSCNMPVAKHLTSPCESLSATGGEFSMTRDILINSSVTGTEVSINFRKTDGDRSRSLKIVEITPKRDMENENQEFWFSGGLKGPNGANSDVYFVTLRFTGKNPKNSDNGRGGWTENGTYNGQIKFKDTKSDAVYTLNLKVNVRSIESGN